MARNCPTTLYRYLRAEHALSFIRDPWLKITPPIQFNDVYELTGHAGRKHDETLEAMVLQDRGARTTAANWFNSAFGVNLKQNDLARIAEHNRKLWRSMARWYIW